MTTPDLYGWDLLFRTIKPELKSESDIIVALVHWFLTKNASLLCFGVGDSKTLSPDDEGSELLPAGWNANQHSYALRYAHHKELFLLLAVVADDHIVLNLLNVETNKTSSISLTIGETVKSMEGNLKTIIPDILTVLDRIRAELMYPVFMGRTTEVTTQTLPEPDAGRRQRIVEDPLMIGRPRGNFEPSPIGDPLRDIGRGDLDPLGRGGGGMLFPGPGIGGAPFLNPFPGPNRGGLPPPPPGARFDPFGPPEAGRANPNPDHLRPPPDFDDMYM